MSGKIDKASNCEPIVPDFQKLLTEIVGFKASGRDFEPVIASAGLTDLIAKSENAVIFASSFNPPHAAHAALCELGIADVRRIYGAQPKKIVGLLIYCLGNPDKKPQQNDFIAHLLTMTSIFAQKVFTESNWMIVLSRSGLFPDMSSHVKTLMPNCTQIFPLGFDTFIRFINPRYYPENKTTDVLRSIFNNASVVVGVRRVLSDDAKAIQSATPEQIQSLLGDKANEIWKDQLDKETIDQLQDFADIEAGAHPDLLVEWHQKIRIATLPRTDANGVSSTKIRAAIRNGSIDTIRKSVFPEVLEYAIKHLFVQYVTNG